MISKPFTDRSQRQVSNRKTVTESVLEFSNGGFKNGGFKKKNQTGEYHNSAFVKFMIISIIEYPIVMNLFDW